MDAKIKVIIASAVIAVCSLSVNVNANAGFYNWLENEKEESIIQLSYTPADNNTNTFENLFAWSKRKFQTDELEEEEPTIKVVKTHIVRATGYSSTPDQTDDSPFITASGTTVRDGIIAANFHSNGRRVPFGTLVRIPEIYGEKIFIVEDRMNARYTNNIDVWFPERSLAKEFGSRRITIEIVEES